MPKPSDASPSLTDVRMIAHPHRNAKLFRPGARATLLGHCDQSHAGSETTRFQLVLSANRCL